VRNAFDSNFLWERIRLLPKVELHLHLEGSIRRSLYLSLAKKYGVEEDSESVPGDPVGRDIFDYQDFAGFMDCFRQVCSVLKQPVDLINAASALFDDLMAQNVLYAEIFLSPILYPMLMDWSVFEVLPEIHREALRRKERNGFECRFLFDSVRQWGPEAMQETLALAEQFRQYGVIGIGVGGDEGLVPAKELAPFFEQARQAGFHTTAHAGESQGPGSVGETLRYLRPERIGHGLHAAEDPALLWRLREKGTVLDISLTSNLRTGVCRDMATHPLSIFRENRIPFTINTDDPGIFDTDLTRELCLAAELLQWTEEDVHACQLRAAQSCFLDSEEKSRLIKRLNAGFAELASC
jgi:adenosine deaminase